MPSLSGLHKWDNVSSCLIKLLYGANLITAVSPWDSASPVLICKREQSERGSRSLVARMFGMHKVLGSIARASVRKKGNNRNASCTGRLSELDQSLHVGTWHARGS